MMEQVKHNSAVVNAVQWYRTIRFPADGESACGDQSPFVRPLCMSYQQPSRQERSLQSDSDKERVATANLTCGMLDGGAASQIQDEESEQARSRSRSRPRNQIDGGRRSTQLHVRRTDKK